MSRTPVVNDAYTYAVSYIAAICSRNTDLTSLVCIDVLMLA